MERKKYQYFSFGTFRFLLAFFVTISHLWVNMIDGYGAYSVWGFYVLSGYLMTYVLIYKYQFSLNGLKDYLWNRFLRIIPLYWLAGILSFFALKYLAEFNLQNLNPAFAFPNGRQFLFSILPFPFLPHSFSLVPVAGALGTEWGMYFLMPLLAINKVVAWLVVLFGAIINFSIGLEIKNFGIRYSHFLFCMLPFGVGSLLVHYGSYLRRFSDLKISMIVWLLHGLVWIGYDPWPWTYGLYFSLILTSWVVISADCEKSSDIDVFLGDLSYPMYLLHTTIAAFFVPRFGFERSFVFFSVSLIFIFIASSLVVQLIDKPLRKFKIIR